MEYETVHKEFHQNQVRKGYVIPKVSPFKAVKEGNGEVQAEESDRAISPLYMDSRPDLYGENNEAQDVDQESGKEVEVELSQLPVIKTEYGSEYEEEAPEDPEDAHPGTDTEVKEEPKSEEGYEEEEKTKEESEEEPPRTVIFEEHENAQEDGETTHEKMTERERIKEDQRTKSAKERLGKRQPDKEGRPNVYDRIRTPPRETNTDQTETEAVSQSISPRTTSTIMRANRGFLRNLRKSKSERDRQSKRQERQRADSTSKEFLAALSGQKTKEGEESTESKGEDKDMKTSRHKSSKPKK